MTGITPDRWETHTETHNSALIHKITQQAFTLTCQDVDRWNFDVFALNSASCDHSLQTLLFELVVRYELNSRFKVRYQSVCFRHRLASHMRLHSAG